LIRKLTTDGLHGLLGELLGKMNGDNFPSAHIESPARDLEHV